jgi:hypothetical protein
MATRVRLDRKARTAIWILVGLALTILVLVGRNAVASLTPQKLATLESGSTSDELLVIGGHSVLLKHGNSTDRISHSVHDGNDDSRAFEIGDRSFASNSDQLTSEGSIRADQISKVMVHVPRLAAQIVPLVDNQGTGLLSRRMQRFRANLIADGVAPNRVTLSHADGTRHAAQAAGRAELIVVLKG